MKLKIKVKNNSDINSIPKIIKKGEWVDLISTQNYDFIAPQSGTRIRTSDGSFRNVTFNTAMINLGIAMKLPKGFEAIVLPRSSTFKNYGIMMTNSAGVIDNSYSGNNDTWYFPAVAFKASKVSKGDRVCQFRIQLSQKATVWQKIKWFFSSGIEIVEVTSLDNSDRGGFGSTGV